MFYLVYDLTPSKLRGCSSRDRYAYTAPRPQAWILEAGYEVHSIGPSSKAETQVAANNLFKNSFAVLGGVCEISMKLTISLLIRREDSSAGPVGDFMVIFDLVAKKRLICFSNKQMTAGKFCYRLDIVKF